MDFLAKKYLSALSAKDEYILDPVILMHAWKKAHHSIRSTNWYADVFELDRSAIELEQNVQRWKKELESGSFNFSPLKLVPAPKTESWGFDEKDGFNWKPSIKIEEKDDSEKSKELRPIAHVDMRDQTIMTALMMLLANQVETLQGDSSVDFEEVHEKGVVNYGNRLYCHYHDDKASFLWGNQSVYSQYFKDYQQFLARPIYFGKKARSTAIESETVYEVNLDLEKFYDNVSRPDLIEKIKEIINSKKIDPVIEKILGGLKAWEWREGDGELYKKVCASKETSQKIPKGIPQGLVAGGFLANIYLIDFDKAMREMINVKFDPSSIIFVDYCRYVDDMKIILKINGEGRSHRELKKCIKYFIDDVIAEKLPKGLGFNDQKTKIEIFSLKTLGISNTLKDIQTKMSGPLSESSVDEQLERLEGLIGLAESLRDKGVSSENNNPLACIENLSLDARTDTLLRSTANRIHKLLQQKRNFIVQEVDENGQIIAGDWDYLQERMARRFIAVWSKDPSLIVLLKKGLELFPDTKILTPVLEQLKTLLDRDEERERQIAIFCIGEVFRHAATIIHSKDRWAIPAQANVDVFFGVLVNEAVSFIQKYEGDSRLESLVVQARLLCLVKNDSPFEVETKDVRFNIISKMMKGYRTISGVDHDNFFINTLLAYQLAHKKNEVIKAVSHILDKGLANKKRSYLALWISEISYISFAKRLIIEAHPVFYELFNYAKKHGQKWIKHSEIWKLVKKSGIKQQPYLGELTDVNNQDVSLLSIVKRLDNPFAHENAVLKLVSHLLNKERDVFNSDFDFVNTKIKCSNWDNLQSFDSEITCILNKGTSLFFCMPKWVKDEHKPFYRLGMFIRSCLLGSVDWTQNASVHTGITSYRGIKTSFAKRQTGMMQSAGSFHGDVSPTSNWLAELLFFLLQHPGIQFNGDYSFSEIKDWSSLKKVLKDRVLTQKQLFCTLSGMPSYVEKVDLKWEDATKKSLNVVMVQSLLPYKKDFQKNGIKLDNPQYRANHRRHVASVAELLLHKVYSQRSVKKELCKNLDVDLIVWPELAVHYDDMDILERLSDKTGAIILAGITFLDIEGVKGPNNVAMWLIPNKKDSGRQFIKRLQGKQHLMKDEREIAHPWRPYQLIVELSHPAFKESQGFRLTSSICYDATDLKISADLKDKTDAYIIPSLNKDIATFDNMVDALYYHMYQHVMLVNTGEFGGSVAKAPYAGHDKLITHVHGSHQVSISSFEMNMFDFRDIGLAFKSDKKLKTKPAG